MKCPRCSAEVPTNSNFCLRCGTPLQVTHGSTRHSQPYSAFQQGIHQPRHTNSSTKWIALGAIGLVLVGALAWSVSSRMLQHPAQAAQPAPLVQAPATTTTAPLVQAPATTTPNRMVQAPAQPGPQTNVAAISNYLAFLRKVEQMKKELIGKEMGAALGTYGYLTPDEIKAASSDAAAKQFLPHISQDSARVKAEWDQLVQYFLSVQPPPECVTLQQKYYEHLAKIEAQFVKVNDSLADAQSNPQEALNTLSGMLGTASADADASAEAADQALADVCNRYGLSKDFSITTGSNTSSLLH